MGMWTNPITVAETRTFVQQADDVWSDDEREAFVDFIARNPEASDIIRDGGGVRKVRWGRQGTGKRGGVRVIYFFHDLDTPLYLLLVYAKAVRTDISLDAKKAVREFAERIKQAHRRPAGRRNR
ncbi:MAG: type II toxin-antitoxin system RelE/ParE family toxin [Candidatus Binataceae bacterium]